MIEVTLKALLGPLVSGRVSPDTTPDNPVFPLIVYQQVGGQALAFMEKRLPDHQHARIQVVVWSKSRLEARQMIRSVERTLIESTLTTEAYGAAVSDYNAELKLRGFRQDFGIWFKDEPPP